MKSKTMTKIGKGNRIMFKILGVSSLLTIVSLVFLLLFIKSILVLDSTNFVFLVKQTVVYSSLGLCFFLYIITRWLLPLQKMIDTPPDKNIYFDHREKYTVLIKRALNYPSSHIALNIVSANFPILIVAWICYSNNIMLFEEVAVLCNSVFIFSVFNNMLVYKYMKEIIPPVLFNLSILEKKYDFIPVKLLSSVRQKIVFFVGVLVLTIILFFVQLIVLISLYNSKQILTSIGSHKLMNLVTALDNMTSQTAGSYEDLMQREEVKGISHITVFDPTGFPIIGYPSKKLEGLLQQYINSNSNIPQPLFAETYIYDKSDSGYLVGLSCNWRECDLELLQFSPWYIFFVISMAFLSLFLARQISADISQSVRELHESMAEIARGEGDLTKRIAVFSNREFADLANCFNLFLLRLSMIIKDIQSLSTNLTSSLIGMKTNSDEFISESRIQETIIQSVSESTTTFNEFKETFEKLMSHVAKLANDSFSTAKEGIDNIQKLYQEFQVIKSTSETSNVILQQLDEKSKSVQGIVETVERIADQTRLLSFNAMIEAVSAGESGNRFEIVAEQVRTLANDVTGSATTIKDIISLMVNTIRDLSSRHQLEQKKISELYIIVETTTAEFNKIVTFSEKTAQAINNLISEISNQQRMVTESTQMIESMIANTQKVIKIGSDFQRIISELNSNARQHEANTRKFKVA